MSDTPNPYDIVIADLENKRDQINAAIEMLRALSATGAIALPLPASPQRAVVSEGRNLARCILWNDNSRSGKEVPDNC